MAYTPDPTDVTQPDESVSASTAAAEFRALKQYIQTLASGGGPGAEVPGTFKQFMLPAVPAGWILGNGGTIGSLTSGASVAGPQTQALFEAWWAFTDAQLPIYTSTGAPSSRGASAAADWAANKRLSIFDVRDRFMRNSGAISVVGTKQEGSGIWTDPNSDGYLRQVNSSAGVQNGESAYVLTTNQAFGAGTQLYNTPNQRFVKVRPDNIGILGCFKL